MISIMLCSLSLMQDIPYEIYGAFEDMVNNPEVNVNNSLEILDYALAGRVNLKNHVNLFALDRAFTKYIELNTEQTIPIIFTDDDKELKEAYEKGNVCIGNRCTALQVKDVYNEFLESEELNYAISKLKSLEKELVIYEHINIFM